MHKILERVSIEVAQFVAAVVLSVTVIQCYGKHPHQGKGLLRYDGKEYFESKSKLRREKNARHGQSSRSKVSLFVACKML